MRGGVPVRLAKPRNRAHQRYSAHTLCYSPWSDCSIDAPISRLSRTRLEPRGDGFLGAAETNTHPRQTPSTHSQMGLLEARIKGDSPSILTPTWNQTQDQSTVR